MAAQESQAPSPSNVSFLSGGGEMGAYMRGFDWSRTPLGPAAHWPQSLKTVVRIILDSRYAMWMGWGPDLTFFYNDAYGGDTLGKKHPWALGRPTREVWAEIWADISPRIERVMKTGQATWDEALMLFLERSGYSEESYHTFSYSPLYDDAGKLGGMLCVVTEETERIISERRVALLRDLAAALTTSKSEADVFGAVERCLKADGRDLPFTVTFLKSSEGDGWRRVLCTGVDGLKAECADEHAWPLDRVLEENAPVVIDGLGERVHDLPSGPWPKAPTHAMLVPIGQAGQARRGVFVAGLNPHRPVDEGYRGFINLFVGQITAALANAHAYEEERRRAEALAELDRAKTTFFSNVSHEFRTPLTLMLGPLVDTLAQQNGALPPRAAEELSVVHRNGLRLLKLVNTLLDFSRIEAGRVQASFVPTDLPAFTAELASVFRSAVERAGLTLTIDTPPLPEAAYVDRDMWEKIVLNLISNAFKFTLDGGITVRMRQEAGQIRLSVGDTGTGIPEAELPRLFERFHRIEGTRGRTHEGTGIGLALVQELVKLHGGKVSAESEVGRGTTFTVTIPAGRDHLPAERVTAPRTLASTAVSYSAFVEEALRWLPEGNAGEAAGQIGSMGDERSVGSGGAEADQAGQKRAPRPRVIVADDNADMRDYVRRLLSERYEVEVAADGDEALEKAKAAPPAVIVSDVMMPNVDGFELLKRVRSDPATAAVPVVLLSARAGEEATLDGIRAGADDYVVKPFSARELIARVDAQVQRKAFERQLTATEQRLRAALGAAKMAACEWDPASDVVTSSESMTDVFGLRPGQALDTGAAVLKLLHPDDVERHRETMGRAVERREGFASEFRIIRPVDGRVAWLSERCNAVQDPAAVRLTLVGLVTDVTERKEAEIALRHSEARARFFVQLDDALRTLTDPDQVSLTAARMLAGHFRCDRAMYVEVDADEDGCTVTGEYSPGLPSILGRYRISQYGTDYVATVRANRPYVENDTTRDSMPADERAKFAALHIGSFISSPLFKNGRLVAMFVVHNVAPRKWTEHEIEDVWVVASRCWESVERARIERALRESEERLALSVESAELGTFYCPMPLGKIIWNAKCKEHFWLRADAEIDFELFYSILHPADRERTRYAVERAVFHREPYDIEYRTVAPDGRHRWIRAKGRAFYDQEGKPARFDGVTLDITELKAEQQRREQRLAVEQAAREEAERVSRMKDEFLATLSHELRTPLNAILGWSQILNQSKLETPDAKEGLEAIERNARAQTQMIEDLLDMSRIVSGRVRLDVQRLVLADVVAQAVQSVRPSAEVKGVRLTTVLDPYAGPVAGDPNRLQQVVWNLLTNAIKFTPRGGQVQVILERVNSHLELSVTDTGEGIDPSFLPHVFERFRQADASTTRKHGGLGLGLNIVKQLVELHGGTVRAKSAGAGRGATFSIALPLAAVSQPAEDRSERRHPRTSGSNHQDGAVPDLSGVSVLVVDDDPDARDVMKRILASGGAAVTTASTAAEALELLRTLLPTVLVSDIGMPGEDGYDLMRKVRELPEETGGKTPAIALTAFARSEDRQRAMRAGYQIHVSKPVEPAELLTVCASLAGRVG